VAINFIPNDPFAAPSAPGIRRQARRANRPATRAGFTFSNVAAEGTFAPGTPDFLFWQCREAGLAALQAWEKVAGNLNAWQGNRKKLRLLQDEGLDLNAYYDRASFSFFHQTLGGKTFFSGASTDVVAHEVGHGLLDAIRPDLWDAPFLETGAFHEAFGDCVAILTALGDRATRKKLLAVTKTLRKKNFVESTAEELSDGIGRLVPTHNAAEPRHAYNRFKFQIPETLPFDGGPGKLINEVHSFGMLFSGCFYDLIANIFAAQGSKTEAALLASAKTAGALLMAGTATALITPRFFQSVGRAMELADTQNNGSKNRDRIRAAFRRHNIMLGANTLLAPSSVLAGSAPSVTRGVSLGVAARRDLAARIGAEPGARLSVDLAEMSGERFARVTHTRQVELGAIDKRLKGVTVAAPMPTLVGASGKRAAVMGQLPDTVSTEREVQAFVESLVSNGQIEFGNERASAAPARRRAVRSVSSTRADSKQKNVPRETHRVATIGGKKVLQRVRFQCPCG
jgi:hypothetical protein